jgi:hypothetical protein
VDYLSNPRGERRLGDPGERAAIGAAIAGAIREHLGACERTAPRGDFTLHGNQPVCVGLNARAGAHTARFVATATLSQAAHTPRLRVRIFDQADRERPLGHAQYVNLALQMASPIDLTFRLSLTPGVYWIELAIEGSDDTARVEISGRSLQIAMNEGGAGEPADEAYAGPSRRREAAAWGRAGWAEAASTPAEAVVTAFAARAGSSVWHPSLTRAAVATRLTALLANPDLVDQGSLNLCGPAAFFHLWFHRDPLAAVSYATSLFESGSGLIGSLTIEPGGDLKAQDYGAIVPAPAADWMMLSALRDWENDFADFEGTPSEDAAGITTPAELAKWMQSCGAYRSVLDEGNWVYTKGLAHALTLAPSASHDVVLLVNANMIRSMASGRKKSLLDSFPNHYIRLLDPITRSGSDVTFRFWTWGHAPTSATVSASTFEANYYGSITGNV